MNDRSVHHDTVTLSQTYDAPVDRVYRAWAQADELGTWYVPGDDTWKAHMEHVDFRVDGGVRMTFGRRRRRTSRTAATSISCRMSGSATR